MSLATRRTPERMSPMLSGLAMPKMIPTNQVLTTGGGVVTMTAAQALSGLLLCDCQDAQTFTLPTATILCNAIPGCEVGTTFSIDIVNYGDTTLTIGLGTGVTKTTIATVAPVLTIVTLASKRITLNCTGVAFQGSTADAWVVYAFGSTAAAVA